MSSAIAGKAIELSWLRLLAVFDNGIEALSFLQTRPVDLIFLDINMGDFSGIQLLESIRPDGQVVISTAYHEYALKGFGPLKKIARTKRRISAISYLTANTLLHEKTLPVIPPPAWGLRDRQMPDRVQPGCA